VNTRSRRVATLRGSVGTRTRKMSQLLGTYGLLDFTVSGPVLPWQAFWNFRILHFFSGRGKPRITETMDTGVSPYLLTKCHMSPSVNWGSWGGLLV